MNTVNLLLRRTHLYLGLLLIPWMVIYALSTFLLNHGPTFRRLRPGPEAWTPLWQTPFRIDLPNTQPELRDLAGSILREHGLADGPFGVRRSDDGLIINAPRFLKPLRVTYRAGEGTLTAERRQFAWVELLLRLHFRAGYGQVGPMAKLWGFIVDVVCLSLLAWVVTGLYLWWKIPSVRHWGWAALGAGALCFASMWFAL